MDSETGSVPFWRSPALVGVLIGGTLTFLTTATGAYVQYRTATTASRWAIGKEAFAQQKNAMVEFIASCEEIRDAADEAFRSAGSTEAYNDARGRYNETLHDYTHAYARVLAEFDVGVVMEDVPDLGRLPKAEHGAPIDEAGLKTLSSNLRDWCTSVIMRLNADVHS
jgi:hypothetical protein